MSNVLWITGLSAAGKTTIAELLSEELRLIGRKVVLLDGDSLREIFDFKQSNTRDERLANAYKFGGLARLIASQGVTVIIATIGLYSEIHEWNRVNQPGFFQIYLKVDLTELQRRDPKGIYARYNSGKIRNVAGLDIKIDEPEKPDIVIKNQNEVNPRKAVEMILNSFWQKYEKNGELKI